MFILVILLFLAPALFTLIDFIFFLSHQENLYPKWLNTVLAFILIAILPLFYINVLEGNGTFDCCNTDIAFSPKHRFSLYTVIIFCQVAFFISFFRKKIMPPLIEVLVTCFLLVGVLLNITLSIQLEWISFFGTVPIVFLFLKELYYRYQMVTNSLSEYAYKNIILKKCHYIVKLKFWKLYPVIFILSMPLLLIIALLLCLFGQQPDSLIKVFTETYHHNLSELTPLCDNVQCGGHYLCSVAANGSKKVVKPIRIGIRNNNYIICNRQLLIANSFEHIIEQYLPHLHKRIRKQYDKVGDYIHKDYTLYENKVISTLVYIAMKPLEWFFLLTIYCTVIKPENLIALQYTNSSICLKKN